MREYRLSCVWVGGDNLWKLSIGCPTQMIKFWNASKSLNNVSPDWGNVSSSLLPTKMNDLHTIKSKLHLNRISSQSK